MNRAYACRKYISQPNGTLAVFRSDNSLSQSNHYQVENTKQMRGADLSFDCDDNCDSHAAADAQAGYAMLFA